MKPNLYLAACVAMVCLVTSVVPATMTFNFTSGVQGWTQIYPTNPALSVWENNHSWLPADNGHLGTGWESPGETRWARSPSFYLDGSGDMTFEFWGGVSSIPAPASPSLIPPTNQYHAGYMGVALRDVAANTYVLSRDQLSNEWGLWITRRFTQAELAPYVNDGRLYTLDFIDYDWSESNNLTNWGWVWLRNVSIPGLTNSIAFLDPPYTPFLVTDTVTTVSIVVTNVGIVDGIGVVVNDTGTNWQALSNPFVTNVGLDTGWNTVSVGGTNCLGTWFAAHVMMLRAGPPFVDVTNDAVTVPIHATKYKVAGTNNVQIAGGMWVSNETKGGSAMVFAATPTWTAPAVDLIVGSNTIVVGGTNIYGIPNTDSVVITRSDTAIIITNPAAVNVTVPYAQTQFHIVATNVDIVGEIAVIVNYRTTNWYPAANPVESDVPLDIGPNVIRVCGTNAAGIPAYDAVMVNRRNYRGSLVAWGYNNYRQTNCPPGNDYVAVEGGWAHAIALRMNGSIVAWGWNTYRQTNCLPGNDYVSVAAGSFHSVALKTDGSLVAWGSAPNNRGQTNCPPGNDYVTVTAHNEQNVALKADGTLVAWGDNSNGQTNCPSAKGFLAVASGDNHNIALAPDGSLVAWGFNWDRQTNCPPGNDYIAMAAGFAHSVALRVDGSLVAWGDNAYGQTNHPPGNDFTAIRSGFNHTVALKQNGRVVAWGGNNRGQTSCPVSDGFTAIGAGGEFSLAISVGGPVIVFTNPPGGMAAVPEDVADYTVVATNDGVVGELSVVVNGGTTGLFAAVNPFATNIALLDGTNVVSITGTNVLGGRTTVSARIIRIGVPLVDITNEPAAVNYHVTSYAVSGTNNMWVVGDMWLWNEAASGTIQVFAASANWTAPPLDIYVGTNTFVVCGTNDFGAVTNDSVMVIRRPPTILVITNPSTLNVRVSYAQSSYVLAGAMAMLVGDVGVVVNHRTTNWHAASAPFEYATDLCIGPNLITVFGTNSDGQTVSDTVMINRGNPPGRLEGWASSLGDWGGWNMLNYPSGYDYVAISANMNHSVALKADGSLAVWGSNGDGQYNNCPTGTGFTVVGTACLRSLAVTSDGSIVQWGHESLAVPEGTGYVAVAGTWDVNVGLTSDGLLRGEGAYADAFPGTHYVAMAAGMYHVVALRDDGSLVQWDPPGNEVATPPGNDYLAVAAGFDYSVALKANGSLVSWGMNYEGANCPTGADFTMVAAGYSNGVAILNNGTLTTWGLASGDCPAGSNYIAVAAGDRFNVAIAVGDAPCVDITNDCFEASIGIPRSVAGTNNSYVVGGMWISNAANGNVASFPVAQSWVSAAVNIELLTNTIYVFGSNHVGITAHDSVTVIGVPEGATLCAIMLMVATGILRRHLP